MSGCQSQRNSKNDNTVITYVSISKANETVLALDPEEISHSDENEEEAIINADEASQQVLANAYDDEADMESYKGSAWPSETSRLTPMDSNYRQTVTVPQ